ncbi:TonB-dependent receptor [Flagellatimonas centrodinii]|uniref:TonB-dependent receptor domain-containing protein n=1 Tax=Flagellatimonas centrodinii TaxID=2806210 RepID=UPI001FEFDFE8|nr:TonB-dependent receptor [Flagellatimonas centrodinii]ULQ46908.1 TonB-dependent receptor [Flagellatimonas centrodinii]
MSRTPRRQPARRALWAIIAGIGWAVSPVVMAQDGAMEADATAFTLSQTQAYQIDAGSDLGSALDAVASLNDLQIAYSSDLVDGRTAPALQGEYTLQQALDALLAGSGLEAAMVGDNALVVRRIAPPPTTQSAPAPTDVASARRAGVEEIIVTGQKKAERLQDVPIAISAFSMEQLDAQKIEGGFDLLKGVPNVTFSKTNFTGYNFQIRGIGTQAVSATTDPGVAVSMNNTTLIVNRLFEQEYLDIERVEVLRGPQGTLFGRNATSGVINVITNKPEMGVWAADLKMEIGNYQAQRLRGHVNVPIGDEVAVRAAYALTKRDGFGFNEFDGSDVDNRDLWTGRLSLGWQPSDRFRANLIWERFEEDDERVRTSKQLCHYDPGPVDIDFTGFNPFFLAAFSQGCAAGSLYDRGEPGLEPDDPAGAAHGAYGTPNGASLPFVSGLFIGPLFGGTLFNSFSLGGNPYVPPNNFVWPGTVPEWAGEAPCAAEAQFEFVTPINLCNPDPYRLRGQSRDLRTISSALKPVYQARADVVEFSFDFDWTDALLFSSQTVYVEDELFTTQDYNRFQSFPIFNDANNACGANPPFPGFPLLFVDCSAEARGGYPGASVLAGGEFCDPQLGCSNLLIAQDISQSTSTQYNQEFRLVSSFSGDWNFSLGANFTRFKTKNDYFVFANALTLLSHFFPFNYDSHQPPASGCNFDGTRCISVDPKPLQEVARNPEGHNFFLSANPYELTSSGLFGEAYWQATDTVKVTAGLRMTWDRKVFTPLPSQLLLFDYRELAVIKEGDGPEACLQTGSADAALCRVAGNAPGGIGFVASPDIVQEWREPTGRIVVDWKPFLSFTDETLVYASYSRGYKGGGANPPTIAPPAGLFNQLNSGGVVAPLVFQPEYVNAFELGTKNMLFGGGLILNAAAFFYDYTGYQVSKIVDRSAANENFDAQVWGLELESVVAPSVNLQFNAAIGFLQTRIADGEQSLDLMDRTDGGNRSFSFDEPLTIEYTNDDGDRVIDSYTTIDEWLVAKPFVTNSSNCVVPKIIVEHIAAVVDPVQSGGLLSLCPGGGPTGQGLGPDGLDQYGPNNARTIIRYDYRTMAPNSAQGFVKDLGGNELPNAPQFTVALGAQYSFDIVRDWRATARVDHYWQDESYARVYNTEYDRLRAWTNTNFSFWVSSDRIGLTLEGYVKNAFDESPITGTFLNSDDSGLTTNVFTLDPRLVGLSIRKEF